MVLEALFKYFTDSEFVKIINDHYLNNIKFFHDGKVRLFAIIDIFGFIKLVMRERLFYCFVYIH